MGTRLWGSKCAIGPYPTQCVLILWKVGRTVKWLRVAASFIKRRAADVRRGWDDEVTDVPLTTMITEVIARVRQKDPVQGKWCVNGPEPLSAQRIEALSFNGSRWALSEDSGFNSYPSRPGFYLVKNVGRLTTTMEGSNYWGYGYKTQHSYLRSRLITWKRSEVKIGRNVVKEENIQKLLPRWGQKVRNK